jgi:hypothetical protein
LSQRPSPHRGAISRQQLQVWRRLWRMLMHHRGPARRHCRPHQRRARGHAPRRATTEATMVHMVPTWRRRHRWSLRRRPTKRRVSPVCPSPGGAARLAPLPRATGGCAVSSCHSEPMTCRPSRSSPPMRTTGPRTRLRPQPRRMLIARRRPSRHRWPRRLRDARAGLGQDPARRRHHHHHLAQHPLPWRLPTTAAVGTAITTTVAAAAAVTTISAWPIIRIWAS